MQDWESLVVAQCQLRANPMLLCATLVMLQVEVFSPSTQKTYHFPCDVRAWPRAHKRQLCLCIMLPYFSGSCGVCGMCWQQGIALL